MLPMPAPPCRGGVLSRPPVVLPRLRSRTRRGRRPRRPASFFFHASGGDISRSGATSFCPRRQKDAKTPPKTHGLWNSFRPLAITAQKSPTTNRLYFYPRCRSRVLQCSAVSYRRGTVYLRVVRRSGSDKRTARDSLYDDVRQFKSRVVRGGGFQRTPAAQEVLKPAVSSSVFGHFWGSGQK